MLNSLMPPSSVTCRRYGTFRFAMAIVTRFLPPPAIGARTTGNQEAKGGGGLPWTLACYAGGAQNFTSPLVFKGFRFDVVMLWGACCLGFSAFLRAGEFTVPSRAAYDPSVHLSVEDVAIDTRAAPSIIRLRLKQSKTDPFRQGVDIHLGKTDSDLCPVTACWHIWRLEDWHWDRYFYFATTRHCQEAAW